MQDDHIDISGPTPSFMLELMWNKGIVSMSYGFQARVL